MDRLIQLVRRMGFEYTISGDELHMVFASGTVKWQSACKARTGSVLIYSIYPFDVRNERKAAWICNRVNAALADSCFYYEAENRRVVVRTAVSLTDGYYAQELFREAVVKHCRDVVSRWDTVFCAVTQSESPVDLNR